MLIKIKSVEPIDNYKLRLTFDDGLVSIYDLSDDIKSLPHYDELKSIPGLFKNVQLDESRTCVYWNDYIDLPSDILYEYGNSLEN